MHARSLSKLVVGCLAIAVAGLASCGSGNDAAPQAQAGREGWPEVIRFGLIPSEGGTDIVETFMPLLAHIEDELGIRVEPKPASEYAGVITAMANDQVEAAYFGPKSYTEAAIIADAQAIVRELSADGEPGYYGIIIVNAQSEYQTLEDLRGVAFGFVSPNSTSGWLVPSVGVLMATGEAPDQFFGDISYTGTHGTAIAQVAQGRLPAAATNTLDLNTMARKGEVDESMIREVWRSDLIPAAPIAVRRELPESFKTALRDAVLSFNNNRAELMRMGRGGFVEATDADFDPVRLLEDKRSELAAEAE